MAHMYCPQCKAEYRQGFTRCSDCDVELVGNYVEAVRHPLAKKMAMGDKYGARLWRGTDPHFYLALVWSLWSKKVACYGAPENPPLPDYMNGQLLSSSDLGGFEVWVSEEDLPPAKWILDSANEEFEEAASDENSTKTILPDISPETSGVCPLCFGEFTTVSANCPNCAGSGRQRWRSLLATPRATAQRGAQNARSICTFRPTDVAETPVPLAACETLRASWTTTACGSGRTGCL